MKVKVTVIEEKEQSLMSQTGTRPLRAQIKNVISALGIQGYDVTTEGELKFYVEGNGASLEDDIRSSEGDHMLDGWFFIEEV